MALTGYNATGGNVSSILINGALYKIHTFLSDGTFTPTSNFDVEYLILGGGGGGGSDMGGGGGGGGYLAGTASLIAQAYPVVVGLGGAGAPAGAGQPAGSNGGNSTAFSLIAYGGGGGASRHDSNGAPAGNGGSGGGGSGGRVSNTNNGGLNGTGVAGQGFAGANSGTHWYPGGGGGAGGAGTNNPGNGGVGKQNAILGPNYYWGGGGGGGGYSGQGGNGGLGGGGGGAPKINTGGLGNSAGLNPSSDATAGGLVQWANVPGGNGGANTGGGGGGGAHYNANNKGGNGGSGIVVVRYMYDDDPRVTSVNGPTSTTVGFGETITFTANTSASIADGTQLPYTISGLTSAEISNASLTGNITVTNQIASLQISLTPGAAFSFQFLTVDIDGIASTYAVSNLVSNTQPTYGGTLSLTSDITTETIILKPEVSFANASTSGAIVYSTLSSEDRSAETAVFSLEPLSVPLDQYESWFDAFATSVNGGDTTPTTRQIIIR